MACWQWTRMKLILHCTLLLMHTLLKGVVKHVTSCDRLQGPGVKKFTKSVTCIWHAEIMAKTMSLLLMLVILCLFIPSSQALKCYACTSLYSSDCRDPFVSSSTCNFGDICKKVKYEVNGEQMICLLSFRFGKMHLFLLTNCSFQVQPKQGRPQEFASWGSQIEGVSKQSKSRDNNG